MRTCAIVLLVGVAFVQASPYRVTLEEVDRGNEVAASPKHFTKTFDASENDRKTSHGHWTHHHHHGRHHHHHHQNSNETRRQVQDITQYQEFYMSNVQSLANKSGLNQEDVQTLTKIIKENLPPIVAEDRSDWTEEQWKEEKEASEAKETQIKKSAYQQINDHEHLHMFFEKHDAEKSELKRFAHRALNNFSKEMANRTDLPENLRLDFVAEVERFSGNKIHWRAGVSQNEILKNQRQQKLNWAKIKASCLVETTELERAQYKRFFAAIEKELHLKDEKKPQHKHHRQRHHRHHHRRHHRVHHHDNDEERDAVRHHEDDEDRPQRRRHHSEEDTQEQKPLRHPKRRQEDDENDDPAPSKHQDRRRRHHHHHDSDEEGEEERPVAATRDLRRRRDI